MVYPQVLAAELEHELPSADLQCFPDSLPNAAGSIFVRLDFDRFVGGIKREFRFDILRSRERAARIVRKSVRLLGDANKVGILLLVAILVMVKLDCIVTVGNAIEDVASNSLLNWNFHALERASSSADLSYASLVWKSATRTVP